MKIHAYLSATILLLTFFWVTLAVWPGIYAPSFFVRSAKSSVAEAVAQLPESESSRFSAPIKGLSDTITRLEANERGRSLGIPFVSLGLFIAIAYVIRSERRLASSVRG